MKNYTSENIRNICLMSHGSAGKTTLAEAMLFNAKATDRFGSVNDGTTVCDFDHEETKRHITINTTVAPFEWKNKKINIIDTPGYFDFAGEVVGAARAVETAVIVVPAKNGVEVGTEKSWEYATEANLRKLFFISKMDEENADYFKSYGQLVDMFGKKVIAFEFPIIENEKFVGIVDVIHEKAKRFEGDKFVEVSVPDNLKDKVEELREPLMEAVAETNEELMEKYFEGEAFTDEEVHIGLLQGIEDDEIIPVVCGSAAENAGIQILMDTIVEYVPSPTEKKSITVKDLKSEETIELKTESDETLSALVFKTIADPFVGKISIFKVFSGEIKSDMQVYNSRTGKNEKMSNLFIVRGKKQENASVISAGDIGAVAKLNDTNTNDTFSNPAKPVVIDPIDFPQPSISLAVEPATKGDDEKIGSGLHKLRDEDPTFSVTVNSETHQTLVSGLGEQHLDIIMSKLKTKYGVSVILKDPIVPYRETIKKKIRVEGKHKKQSGGHGQYGHVYIEFEPGEEEALDFQEKIFGGSVPKQYIPAVEKGLKDCINSGVLAGYPVVKLKATLVDGSYHAVDSSEMAFKMAASVAYKKLVDAQPCLLEPIVSCKIIIPDNYMGDIIGDMNKRRGRIMGMVPMAGGKQTIEAEVPMAEMFKYATDLRSMTQGRGQFSMEMARYEEVPANQAPKIIEEAKRKKEEK
ncbi:MAG: elongation factor G [Clostridiales bacterium]|nr:elongation factor G [Clostridiales bacterium]